MNERGASRQECRVHQVVVTRKSMKSDDITAFCLSGLSNAALPSFTAGVHIDVQVAPALTRQYLLRKAPHEQDGKFTPHLFDIYGSALVGNTRITGYHEHRFAP